MNPGDTWLEETHLELNMRFVYQLEHHKFAGPWMGAASDPTIAMQSSIKTMMLPNEALLADKIYRGD
jgi:hypothetical protein